MANNAELWLGGSREYFAGFAILKAAGISNFLLLLLETGPDNYNTPTLLEEIKKLALPPLSPVERDLDPVQEIITPPYSPDNNLEKKLRIDQMIRDLFKEITHLHGQLAVLPEGDRLYEVANLILVKNLKKQRLWNELHYFNNNGHWFDELPENQPKPENLKQEIKNAMSNRAKAKKNLENPLPAAKKEYYQAKVIEWTNKIEKLKSQRDAT